MHELEVLPKDVQLCSDMATGVDSQGQFQWGDSVQIEYVLPILFMNLHCAVHTIIHADERSFGLFLQTNCKSRRISNHSDQIMLMSSRMLNYSFMF
jgi:hypothetical protein